MSALGAKGQCTIVWLRPPRPCMMLSDHRKCTLGGAIAREGGKRFKLPFGITADWSRDTGCNAIPVQPTSSRLSTELSQGGRTGRDLSRTLLKLFKRASTTRCDSKASTGRALTYIVLVCWPLVALQTN